MAKAHILMKDGVKVTVEGSPDEVAELIARLQGADRSKKESSVSSHARDRRKSKSGSSSLVSELIDSGFFKSPKTLGAIKLALEEKGHFYPLTTLSPLLLRFVRKKELRRIKDTKRWTYVG